MSEPTTRRRKNERDFARRWGQNKTPLPIAVPDDVAKEYKAKCARLGLSQNRVANDLIRAWLDEPEDG